MRRQPHGYGIAEAQSLDLRHWATHTATWQYEISALILTIVLNYLTLVVRHTRRMKHSSIHWGNGPSGERKKLERNSLRSKRRREGRYKIVPEAEVLRAAIFDGWIGTAPRRTFWEIREMVEGIIGAGDAAFSSTKKLSRYGNGLYAMVEHGHFGIALVE